jgi:hypothetical protein
MALLLSSFTLTGWAQPEGPSGALPASCSASSGPLALKAVTTRRSGVSPLLVFFDATATGDNMLHRGMTAFQDVTYRWDFGDTNPSGTGTWKYGSNAGHNSKNSATGGIAAHLYVTTGSDASYVVTVKAFDGTNTATCQLGVTAADPTGSNGFGGKSTTCVSSSGTTTPGSGGCPAGAEVLTTSSFAKALSPSHLSDGKRVLFKCGDTFTGDNVSLSGVKWSIGAYGGCEGTQSNRPILRDSGTDGEITVSNTAGDGRIADLDLEGARSAWAVWDPIFPRIPSQITLYNLYSHGNIQSFGYSQGAQWGLIELVQADASNIGTFLNFNENNPPYSGNRVNNLDYAALMGSSIKGIGCCSKDGGIEVVRISACRLCVISNNTLQDANGVGAILKLHNGNTNSSAAAWTGAYTEFVEISDNLFTGNSGAQLAEVTPQNERDDERLRNIVLERNLFASSTTVQGGRQLLISASNTTIRNNVFDMRGSAAQYPIYGVQVGKRGIEPIPRGVEVIGNTCYAPDAIDSQACIAFDGLALSGPPMESVAQNNLFFAPGHGHAVVIDNGKDDIVANNGDSSEHDPAFTNGSRQFNLISDFKPTANYSGGAPAPSQYDALGKAWPATPDRGAVSH